MNIIGKGKNRAIQELEDQYAHLRTIKNEMDSEISVCKLYWRMESKIC